MNDEERARLIRFQRDQQDEFVHDAVEAGGIAASRVVPNGDDWLVQFRFEAGGGASWIVADRERAWELEEVLLLRVSLLLSLPAVA